eukprot:Nk52_evm1s1957 gene=Nk52_evmTU1s1957
MALLINSVVSLVEWMVYCLSQEEVQLSVFLGLYLLITSLAVRTIYMAVRGQSGESEGVNTGGEGISNATATYSRSGGLGSGPGDGINDENDAVARRLRSPTVAQREGLNNTATRGDGGAPSEGRPRAPLDQMCPVCLCEAENPIETNCGHLFCCACFMEYWRHNRRSQAMTCPYCRSNVNGLILRSPQDSYSAHNLSQIGDYNRMYSDLPRTWMETFRDLPILLRRFYYDIVSIGTSSSAISYEFRLFSISIVLLNMLYILSPIDILPEMLLGVFGYFDDFMFLLITIFNITSLYREATLYRHGG